MGRSALCVLGIGVIGLAVMLQGGDAHWTSSSSDISEQIVQSILFSPDGDQIAIGTHEGSVLILDARNRHVEWSLSGYERPLMGLAFSPDGNMLIGTTDQYVAAWDTSDGSQVFSFDSPLCLRGLDIMPHSEKLLLVGNSPRETEKRHFQAVQRWDLVTGKPAALNGDFGTSVTHVATFHHRNAFVTVRESGLIDLWERRTAQERIRLRESGPRANITSIAVSPDDRCLAVGDRFGCVTLLDTDTFEQLARWDLQHNAVISLHFSSDSREIVAGCFSGLIGLLDIGHVSTKPLFDDESTCLNEMTVSPDGTMVVAWIYSQNGTSNGGDLRLWDLEAGTEESLYRWRGTANPPPSG